MTTNKTDGMTAQQRADYWYDKAELYYAANDYYMGEFCYAVAGKYLRWYWRNE